MPAVNYTIYDPPSGRVLRWGTAPDTMVNLQAQAGEALFVSEEPLPVNDVHFVAGQPEPRPALAGASWNNTAIISNGEDVAVLSGLPAGTIVSVTVVAGWGIPSIPDVVVDDGTFEMTASIPGVYLVTAKAWPNTDFVTTITAEDQP